MNEIEDIVNELLHKSQEYCGKIEAFVKDFGGFIVGSLLGIILIMCGIVDLIVSILIVLLFGYLGYEMGIANMMNTLMR